MKGAQLDQKGGKCLVLGLVFHNGSGRVVEQVAVESFEDLWGVPPHVLPGTSTEDPQTTCYLAFFMM